MMKEKSKLIHKVSSRKKHILIDLNNDTPHDIILGGGITMEKGYALLSKSDLLKLKEHRDNNLKLLLLKEKGFLGLGMYFILDNLISNT